MKQIVCDRCGVAGAKPKAAFVASPHGGGKWHDLCWGCREFVLHALRIEKATR